MATMRGKINGNEVSGARATHPRTRSAADLRIAIFSSNYNCVRDGANKALNRLVEYLLGHGAAVRIYSPTVENPPFKPVGEIVSVPSIAFPGRPEYRLSLGLTAAIKEDVRRFRPTHFHISVPDLLGGQAQTFARELGVPVVTSLHTRFETYLRFYGLGFLAPLVEWWLKRFYLGADAVLVPNEPIAADLRAKGWAEHVGVWHRGVDRTLFNPERRNHAWRSAHGFASDEIVVLFFGRLVREKGLDIFEAVVAELARRGHRLRPLIVGDGPDRERLAAALPNAVFTGHLEGETLAEAVASADILINPSVTEAFGNVNLEAMAAGLAVISADVGSARALIRNRKSGLLVSAENPAAYADAAEQLIRSPLRRRLLAMAAVLAATAFGWSEALASVIDTYLQIN